MPIRIVIADDHPVICAGLANIFQGTDCEVVAQAHSGQEAVELTRQHQPNVAVLDIRMPDKSGLAVVEELKDEALDTRFVMFSGLENPTYIARSLAIGAVDFLPKTSTREAIVDSVQRAARGEGPRSDSPILGVRASMSRKRDTSEDDVPLTNRELQVLRHIALGLSNREIGQSLNISIETVKEHVQNILRKLDTPDRTAAAVWAVKKGLV